MSVNLYRLLGNFTAALHQLAGRNTRPDWACQFSDASLDQRAERRTVDALYRGAMVRL